MKFSYNIDEHEHIPFFKAALQEFETSSKTLSLPSIIELLVERNQELIPFNRYIMSKYTNLKKEGTSSLSCFKYWLIYHL